MLTKSASAGTVANFLAGITKLQNNVFSEQLPVPGVNLVAVKKVLVVRHALCMMYPSLVPLERIRCIKTRPVLIQKSICNPCGQHKDVSVHENGPHCTWLYESQNINILQTCLGSKTTMIEITPDMTPMDYFAAGWCIGNSSCEWKLCFYGRILLDCIQMLHAGIKHSTSPPDKKSCELYIGQGIMYSDAKTQEELCDLLAVNFDVVKVRYYCTRDYYSQSELKTLSDQLFGSSLACLIEKSSHLKEVELVSTQGPPQLGYFCTEDSRLDTESVEVQQILKALLSNKFIERLKLVSVQEVKEVTNMLKQMKHTLTHLSIQHSNAIQKFNMLEPLCYSDSKLVYLDLTGTNLGNTDINTRLLLKKTTTLETLILEECQLHSSMYVIAEALKTNQSLRTLDLSGNSFYHWCYSQVCKLAEMLRVNKTLQVLRLYDCGLSQDETTTLFQVFTRNQNSTLQTLNLSDNNYSIKHLGKMLNSNTCLQCVEITVTPFSAGMLAYVGKDETLDFVCKVIVSAMNKNTTLQHLIIHTLTGYDLKSNLSQCQNHDKVKDRIQIVQSDYSDDCCW